ncbi:T9SS type A sorting domain-containing protein [Chryseobacterium pennipullorum]|uniref:Uncharacterized protein n=1 Tax=Chryseobacterium pennipullorum TaxID=2258963 RepID=A0A3D9AXT5_9FLAO|nr:T9SS type A sorting domain-containing protein [Chryseobacterium pennipullorum]REC46144.1 hypothetical protein DRF67_15425 [Chryseobacterium pennipullorum]
MKKLSTLSAVILCSMMEAQYCTPSFQYGADSNMITRVIFGNIDNTSPFQSGTTQAYEDFTAMSTDLQAGNTYQISVKGPSGTFPSDVMVFVDFNHNGNFDDAGESFYIGRLQEATPANALTINGTIAVPANAASGTTRMRVVKNSNVAAYSDPDASNSIHTGCDSDLRSGQTEDYSVSISGNNTGFPFPYCGAENVTSLTVSEISKVEFAGITNDSSIDGNSEVLEDFTTTVFNVSRGGSYPITVTGGTHGQQTVSAYAYIDLNHNNQFDSDEKFDLGYLDNSDPVSNQQSGVAVSNITIPDHAILGETRFRLVKAYESSSWMGTLENLPCPAGWFIGQAEDYTINVQPENLSTREVSKESSIKIHPNPTMGMINIETAKGIEKYEIFSISGQKLQEGNMPTVNITGFAAGVYLMKILTKDKQMMTEKIIKN